MEELDTDRDEVEEAPGSAEPRSLDVVYTEVKDRLEVQLRQIEALDVKTGQILFVAGITLGIAAAAQAVAMVAVDNRWIALFFSLPVLFYFGCMYYALKGWVIREFFRDPEPRPLRDHYLFESPEFTKRRLITHFISSYEWNQGNIKKKVYNVRIASYLLLGEVLASVVVLVARVWFT
jgi:hypothetical protein